MDFAKVEAEFRRLKAQFESGSLTEAEFKAQLEELMIEDEQGRWWVIGYETGRWYVHDGEKWVQQEPPTAAPRATPSRPSAADLPTGSLPKPTRAIPSTVMELRLRRDTVPVLLIAAGWAVCFAGFSALPYGYLWIVPIIGGGIGGLITALVLRRADPLTPWKQVLGVTLGWAVAMAIERSWPGLFRSSWMFRGGVLGFIGGLITALALKWTHPSMQWKHVAFVTLGWGVGWAVGGAVAVSLAGPNQPHSYWVFLDAVWGGIGGTAGSWVMFWQLRDAMPSSP